MPRPLALGRAAYRGARLLRDQWQPPEKLRSLQARRLRALVRHACDHTDFYRRRFDAAGVGPDDVRSPADLGALPITRREDLRAPESLIARGLASTRLLPLPDFDDLSRLVIRHSLRPVLCGLTADVRVVDDVPPEAGGKYRIVKSLVSDHRSRG